MGFGRSNAKESRLELRKTKLSQKRPFLGHKGIPGFALLSFDF